MYERDTTRCELETSEKTTLLPFLLPPALGAPIELETWMPVPTLARFIEGRIGVQTFVENAPYGHHEFVHPMTVRGEPARFSRPRTYPYTVDSRATNAAEAAEEIRAFQAAWQQGNTWDGCTTYRIEVHQGIIEVTPSHAVDSTGWCMPYASRLDEVPPTPTRRSLRSTDWIEDLRRIREIGRARTLREVLRAALVTKRDESYFLLNKARADGLSVSVLKAETVGAAVRSESPADYPFHPKHREPPAHLLFENQPEVQAHRAWIANGADPAEHPDLQDLPEDLRQQLIQDAAQQNTVTPTGSPSPTTPSSGADATP